eukprot:8252342-Alexandrium_andersonii.AAC.1
MRRHSNSSPSWTAVPRSPSSIPRAAIGAYAQRLAASFVRFRRGFECVIDRAVALLPYLGRPSRPVH